MANLFMDNITLKKKLKTGQEVERQQYEEITSLKERLVQALRAQVSMLYCYTLAQYIDGVHSTSPCEHHRKLLLECSHCQRPENCNLRTR